MIGLMDTKVGTKVRTFAVTIDFDEEKEVWTAFIRDTTICLTIETKTIAELRDEIVAVLDEITECR
jgi:hypothetical protein